MRTEDIKKLLKAGFKIIRPSDRKNEYSVKKAILLNDTVAWNTVEFSKDNFVSSYYCFNDKKDRDLMIEIMLEDEKVILD